MCAEEKPSRVNSFQSFNGLTYQGDTQIKQSVALSSKIHCMMRKCDMLNFASNFFRRRNTRFEISNLHDNGGEISTQCNMHCAKMKKNQGFLWVLYFVLLYHVLFTRCCFQMKRFISLFDSCCRSSEICNAFCTGVSMHYAHTQSTNELLHKFIAL